MRFLIIRLGAIGDLIHALPLASALKEFCPNCTLDWVVGDKFAQILENNPLIDNLYVANLSKWRKGWFLPSNIKEIKDFNNVLKKNNYDYSIDAHGMFKSAVIQAFCGAKNRIGYLDYREFASFASNIRVAPKSKRPHTYYHVIKRQLDLLVGSRLISEEQMRDFKIRAPLSPSDTDTIKKIDTYLESLHKDKKLVIFAPATTWVNKHWDEKNWLKLYQLLKNKVNVVFSGTTADLELINRIKDDDNCLILAGKTNLKEYIELLGRADMVISPDSSASHIAWAKSKPSVITIFCATSKYTYAPIGDKCLAFPDGEPKCVPCHKRKCKKHATKCTYETAADEVYRAVLKLLKLD